MNSRVAGFEIEASSAKSLSAPPMEASGWAIAGTLRNTRDWRRRRFAPNPPLAPGETPTTGFAGPRLLPYGREPTSIAFFSGRRTEHIRA